MCNAFVFTIVFHSFPGIQLEIATTTTTYAARKYPGPVNVLYICIVFPSFPNIQLEISHYYLYC